MLAQVIQNRGLNAEFGLDVGCGEGKIAHKLREKTGVNFIGLETNLQVSQTIICDLRIMKGFVHEIPFDNETFDLVTLIRVYEHILTAERLASLKEINRVLKDKDIMVGQIPNMYFPIELHSKLPFQSYLPKPLSQWYLKKFQQSPGKIMG